MPETTHVGMVYTSYYQLLMVIGGMVYDLFYQHYTYIYIIKGSWEAIFRVADDFYSMKSGVWLYITS